MTSTTLNPDWLVLDAGPLIQLDRLGYVSHLSKLYDKVFLPPAVAHELRQGTDLPGSRAPYLPWFERRPASPNVLARVRRELQAGMGEQEAVALALELSATVALDDRKARGYARQLGVALTGTLGLLIELHARKLAARTPAEDIDLLAASGMRLTPQLRAAALVITPSAATKG